jgi:CoA:oxalate CoA-transferase
MSTLSSSTTAASGSAREERGSRRDPLNAIRVLDFTIIMSGPMCTRALADAGAYVIKVEPPFGDTVRQRHPMRSGIGTYFGSMNCGKRSIVLDLTTIEGKEIARRLAERADVLVENFRPGVMKRLGLDYEALSTINPRLIYCSISGFGQTGPKAHAPAYAPVIHAASGYDLANMGYQHDADRPANNGIFIADVLGAAQATAAIHLALYDRERTGRGQSIDLALMDTVMGMLIYEIQAAQNPTGNPRQVYQPVRANDGFVMVAVVTPKNLEMLFDAIGYPEGKTDSRFATVRAKEENWLELLKLIEAWTCRRSAAESEDLLMRAGVPCARYRTVAEAMAEPQAVHREAFARLGTDDEPFLVANPPYKFSAADVRARNLLPTLGGQTDEVLGTLLGLDEPTLARLRAAGVFGKA